MQCLQKIKINFKKLFDVGTSPCSQGEVTMRFSEQIADIFIMHVDTFGNFYVFRRSVWPLLCLIGLIIFVFFVVVVVVVFFSSVNFW